MSEPKKNTAYVFQIPLFLNGGVVTNPTIAAGDFEVVVGDTAATALGTTPTVTPASEDMIKISLAAGEMNADYVAVVCKDLTAPKAWEDVVITIQTLPSTIGDAQTDLDTLTAGVTLAAGAVTDASLAGGLEIVFETDFGTNYNVTRNAWETNVQDFVGTTAADPFNAKVVAASVASGVTLANGAVTDASLAGGLEIVFETDFGTNYNVTRNAWVTNGTDFIGTGWNVNKTGYSVSATGLDAVLEDSTFLTAVESQVWDAVLTGGSHNDATSAGRRLRSIGDFSVYEGGAIWYDDVNGAAGTTAFEHGTVVNPSNAEASVTSLLSSVGLTTIHCAPGSTYVLEATYANKVFLGDNWTLDLNGQSVVGCVFIGAAVSGAMAGTGTTQQFINCIMGATSLIKGTHLVGCGLGGTLTAIEAGDFFIDNSHSAIAGSGSVTFDFGSPGTETNFNCRHHSGGWTIANMGAGAGTCNASFEGNGQIVWAASCVATSNASIRGNWKITDSASGAVTETLDDNQASVDAILVDTGTTLDGKIDTIGTDTAATQVLAAGATGFAAIDTGVDTILVDTADMQPRVVAIEVDTGTTLDGKINTIDTAVDAVKVITDALTAAAAANLALSAAGIIGGVAEAGTLTTEIMTTDLTGYVNDELIGRTVIWTGGAANGQASDITDYASAAGTVTYTAITTLPSAADTFVIV